MIHMDRLIYDLNPSCLGWKSRLRDFREIPPFLMVDRNRREFSSEPAQEGGGREGGDAEDEQQGPHRAASGG